MDTKEAVEVLRAFSEGKWKNRNYTWFADEDKIFSDIANLIEYLQNELPLAEIAADDNGRQVEELQVEMDNLKHDIERYIKINTELLNTKPKRGHWIFDGIKYGIRWYKCSVCGTAEDVPTVMLKPMYKFCPNCGAKMEVQEWLD